MGRALIKKNPNISHISKELWSLFASQSVSTQSNQPSNEAESHSDLEGKKQLADSCSQGSFRESRGDGEEEQAEILDAFFASVFNNKTNCSLKREAE